MYKNFGRDLTIVDQTKRDKSNKPLVVAKFIRPSYRMNTWDFKCESPNTLITALYANNISLANLDKLSCKVCESKLRVEMHHVRMMKDLKPKVGGLSYGQSQP